MKFDTSVAKGLKLKVEKFWGLIPTFEKVTEENLVGVGGLFGLINDSNIDILQKNQYDVEAENVCKGAFAYSLLIYQIS